jgi:hypothetical protein
MPERAKVTSLEAIEAFRSKLIVYREKAGRVLDEISSDVTRTRLWLQQDRVAHCAGEIRRCQRDLEQRQQELFTARIAIMDDPVDVKQAIVRKARTALRDAEGKLQLVRQWNRAFDQRVETPARQVEKLRHVVDKDLGMAVNYLNEVSRTLSAYMELSATTAQPKPPEPETPAT